VTSTTTRECPVASQREREKNTRRAERERERGGRFHVVSCEMPDKRCAQYIRQTESRAENKRFSNHVIKCIKFITA
jgi:hypothetical protein